MDVLKEKLTGNFISKFNVTSAARILNQSVPNHASEDKIFIAIPSAIHHTPYRGNIHNWSS